MISEYILYCFAQSGNAYKAALMLNLCGAQWSPRFVDYFSRETDTPEFRTDELGVDLNDYPSVVRWLEDIKALEGWVHPYELMPGHPLK
jgi:hypothetical protein